MDRFKYQAHLQIIQNTKSKPELIKLMSLYSTFKYLSKNVVNRKHNITITPQFIGRTKEQKIAGVLSYDLYCEAKKRYLFLKYDFRSLPQYAQQPTMSINIDETIKLIEDSLCTQ